MSADPLLLNRILEDTELKKALTEFFIAQAEIEMKTGAELMGQDIPNPDLARKHACFAKAYEEAMNRLRAYAQQV